ncbi:MAG TPA: pyruvate carboxylase subunit B [Clostridiaceae bacterium]|nr:pyruvate carboxylase subunit B [Clostridiaceae bacterium]
MSKLGIQDVTVRDGNQSILATRMKREDILAIAAALDKVGFYSLEVWGGATFDSAYRFLNQSAWENLREINKATPNTKLSMLLRGQNVVGYHHYDNDTLERFIRLTIENGIDILRVFDALNDPDNLRNAFKFTKKHGGHLQAAIAYTVSPVHNNDYYIKLVKTYESMGADSICIKDMSGIITPQTAYELVSAIKQATDLPLNLHSHTTANATSLVMEQAMKAGVDVVDGCISPFSGGTAHLADETLLEAAKLAGRKTALNMEALDEAYELANSIVEKYIESGDLRVRSLIPNPKILKYQVPGGMLSNLLSQLEQQKQSHKLNDVLQEIPKVRKDMGYPPLVTPLSQMVGTQAVFNVLLGERYKIVPNEIKDYVQGLYGQAPGELNQDIVNHIRQQSEKKEAVLPEDLPFLYEKNKKVMQEFLEREPEEEEVVAYTIFPEPVKNFYLNSIEVDSEDSEYKVESQAEQASFTSNNTKRTDPAEPIAFRMVLPTT